MLYQMLFDHILDMLYGLGLLALLLHILQNLFNQSFAGTIPFLHFVIGLMDRFPDRKQVPDTTFSANHSVSLDFVFFK